MKYGTHRSACEDTILPDGWLVARTGRSWVYADD